MSGPKATTHVAAVLGDPVRHSLSPVLHNAAFRAAGLDWVFVAFEVAEERGAAAFAAARALGIDGLSVTMPLKEIAATAVDELAPAARRLGAVNAVVRDADRLVGHNTDADGFLDALGDVGWDPANRSCAVLGAGGAARAVVLALAGAGAGEVLVVNRTPERAEAAAGLGGGRGRVGDRADLGRADLVVNATPLGMAGAAASAPGARSADVVESLRGRGQLVVDLVYYPLRTELLVGAEAKGAATVTGLGMLVHQAARAFTLWTGHAAPLAAMRAAAEETLGEG
jgi:shikimate dehydrogenase